MHIGHYNEVEQIIDHTNIAASLRLGFRSGNARKTSRVSLCDRGQLFTFACLLRTPQ